MPCININVPAAGPILRITNIEATIKPKQPDKIGLPVQITLQLEGTGESNIVVSYGTEKETLKITVVKSPFTFSFVRYFEEGTYNICAELIQ